MRTLLLLVSLGVAASGCSARKGTRTNLGDQPKEQQLLQDSARLYWEAMRWGDSEKAGAFIESADERVLFRDWMEEYGEGHRLESAKVLQVILGPELRQPTDGRLQTADVYVRTKGYTYPAQIVESERVEQAWYRSLNGWFVDWELPEEGE